MHYQIDRVCMQDIDRAWKFHLYAHHDDTCFVYVFMKYEALESIAGNQKEKKMHLLFSYNAFFLI